MRTLKPETPKEQEAFQELGELIQSVDGKLDGATVAGKLLERVGVLRSVYEMERFDLGRQPELSRVAAEAMDMVKDVKRFLELEAFPVHMRARKFQEVAPYLGALMNGRRIEYCYLLCVNRAGNMISCPLLQRGTIDQAAVYAREVALTALTEQARYAVLSHNHPGGSMEPSPADLQVTKEIIEALRAVDVALLDHVIITDRQAVSIRALGEPAESFWIKGREKDKILLGWNQP